MNLLTKPNTMELEAMNQDPRSMSLVKLAAFGALACMAIGLSAERAGAAYTLDRWYQMGDDMLFAGTGSAESASNGAEVGSNASIAGVTYDSAATDNDSFQALTAIGADGAPTYVQYGVGGNPAAPVAGASSMNSFGIRLDGVDDYLEGVALNDPSVTAPGSNVSYSTQDRGFQLWAYPFSPGEIPQWLVDDGDEHGVSLATGGAWSAKLRDDNVDSGVMATTNGWDHLMVVHDEAGLGTGAAYVNGIATSTQGLGYDSGSVAKLLVGANSETDDADLQIPPADLTNPGFYAGIIDEIEMFVIDDGSAYGQFDYLTDNGYFTDVFLPSQSGYGFTLNASTGHNSQQWIDGDIDFDGDFDADDVQVFIDGWLSRRPDLPGAGLQVGDYQTLALGDLDLDGDTDVDDWVVLRLLNPPLGSLPSLAQLNAAPEPTACVLLAAGALACCGPRRRNH
ncbi:hypothetical protein Pla123a_19200 [Posidoniimonas polymericola]|uniref:Uncharacterized protein n=1 Tax=Posidoniimonas polymericola TaxID=2528002 RepID=A0A5C5YQX5_9BACT|nr:LamG domain-containing protein [Posidoniimonas polymericola]TWT77263.1 hypothetical protein Pla123a_19200 [Posidoniimonas polymericola]